MSASEAAARAALIASIDEIAGPENPEVRRALLDAAADMLKTAKLAGSSSPYDHVRMAIERAAANPKRRDTIESLARGILRNWIEEGFPAVHAPEPPGLAKKPQIPDVSPYLAAQRAERSKVEAENAAVLKRWEALPEAEQARIRAAVELANPTLRPFKRFIDSLCYEMMNCVND